jgi:protein tyrosine/serine phosphatase
MMAGAADDRPGSSPPAAAINPQSSAPSRLRLKGVPDFGQVTPRLYRGGQPSKEGFEDLAKQGIDIVVDVRGSREGERKEVTKLGMQYVPIPWHCYNKRDAVFAQFLMLLRKNPNKKVFVHCRLGNDRTGMMIAAYRMAEEDWTAAEARKEMEKFGFAGWHHLICPGLASYETNFPQRFQTSPAFQILRDSPRTSEQR